MATPVIEAADITDSGNDTIGNPVAVDYAAYSTGDLVIYLLGTDQNITHTIPTTGPNGDETIVTIYANNNLGGTGGPTSSGFYYVATSNEIAGSLNVTLSGDEQFAAATINVPSGEFDATTPLQTEVGNDGDDAGTDTAPNTPAWTSGTLANGRIVGWIAVDTDAVTGTATGWTIRENNSVYDRVKWIVTTRDTANTASESIAAAAYTIAGDSWSSLGFVVNEPQTGSVAPQAGRHLQNMMSN